MGMKKLTALVMALVLCLCASMAMAATWNVTDRASAQAALDQAKENDVINLAAGNYGVLYIRQTDLSTAVESTWAGGGPYTWHRTINGLTINGVSGTCVERIEVESHQYTPSGNQHSNSSTAPRLSSYITLNNLKIDGVTFKPNGKVAVNIDGRCAVNGLTIQNCEVIGSGSDRLIYVGGKDSTHKDKNGNTILVTGVDNVKILNNIVSNVHQVLELRQVENIEISGNTFKNVAARDILLNGGSAGAISGKIVISNNTSDGGKSYFLRLNNVAGTVEVDSNTITNCAGDEGNVVKISSISDGATVSLSDCIVDGVKLNLVASGSNLLAPLPKVKAPSLVDANNNRYVDESAVFNGVGDLVFKSTAEFDTFVRAAILRNGKVVTEVVAPALKNADGTVTVTKGSIKVTLSEAFLSKLTPGVYTIAIEDDYSVGVSGTFRVNARAVANLPKTGDNSSLMLWVSLLVMTMVGFVLVGKKTRLN